MNPVAMKFPTYPKEPWEQQKNKTQDEFDPASSPGHAVQSHAFQSHTDIVCLNTPIVMCGEVSRLAAVAHKSRYALRQSTTPPPSYANVSGEPTGLKDEYQKFWRCLSASGSTDGPAAHLQNFSLPRPWPRSVRHADAPHTKVEGLERRAFEDAAAIARQRHANSVPYGLRTFLSRQYNACARSKCWWKSSPPPLRRSVSSNS